MNKRERFLTAVRREVPDIVPVSPLIHDRFAYTVLRRTGWRAVFQVHQMVGSIYFRGPTGKGWRVEWSEGFSTSAFTKREDGKTLIEHWIKTPTSALRQIDMVGFNPQDPVASRTIEYFIKNESAYEIYKAYVEEWIRRAKPDFTELVAAVETMGNEGVAQDSIGSAFSELVSIRGVRGAYMDLYVRPKTVEDVLKILWEKKEKEVEAFLDSPSEVLYYDVWGAFELSPKQFERFVLPELKTATELVRKVDGKYIGFYMVGKGLRKQLPMVVETRPHFIEPFELQSGVSLREAKRLYGDKVCIMGNFDPVILAFGNLEDVKKETIRCLEEGMENGGYVLVTGDEVPANAKLENLITIVRTVEEYGKH
jgi:uroporphyrinogen-III decarboxylase